MRFGIAGALSLCTATALAGCAASAPAGSSSSSSRPSLRLSTLFANLPDGSATISFDRGTQLLSLQISAFGFTPGRAHAIHIHAGSCLARSSRIVAAFPDGTSDAQGALTLSTHALQRTPGGIPKGSYLDIHLVASSELGQLPDPTADPIACTDLTAGTASASVRLYPIPGHKPYGTAALTWNGSTHTISVQLTLMSLGAGSRHGVDIRAGTCHSGAGEVQLVLQDITADASGTVHASLSAGGVTSPPPTSGWFAVVHLGSTPQQSSGGVAAALTQAALCGDLVSS